MNRNLLSIVVLLSLAALAAAPDLSAPIEIRTGEPPDEGTGSGARATGRLTALSDDRVTFTSPLFKDAHIHATLRRDATVTRASLSVQGTLSASHTYPLNPYLNIGGEHVWTYEGGNLTGIAVISGRSLVDALNARLTGGDGEEQIAFEFGARSEGGLTISNVSIEYEYEDQPASKVLWTYPTPGPVEIAEGETATFAMVVSAGTVTWTVDGDLVATGSVYQWTAGPADAGEYVVVAALDDTPIASWVLTVASVNQPPTVTITSPTPGIRYKAGSSVILRATAVDPDGDGVTLSWSEGGRTIGAGEQTVRPGVGVHTYTVTASDGEATATASVTVVVGEVVKESKEGTPLWVWIVLPIVGLLALVFFVLFIVVMIRSARALRPAPVVQSEEKPKVQVAVPLVTPRDNCEVCNTPFQEGMEVYYCDCGAFIHLHCVNKVTGGLCPKCGRPIDHERTPVKVDAVMRAGQAQQQSQPAHGGGEAEAYGTAGVPTAQGSALPTERLTRPTICAGCRRIIKEGELGVRCGCRALYHQSCAAAYGSCTKCGAPLT